MPSVIVPVRKSEYFGFGKFRYVLDLLVRPSPGDPFVLVPFIIDSSVECSVVPESSIFNAGWSLRDFPASAVPAGLGGSDRYSSFEFAIPGKNWVGGIDPLIYYISSPCRITKERRKRASLALGDLFHSFVPSFTPALDFRLDLRPLHQGHPLRPTP